MDNKFKESFIKNAIDYFNGLDINYVKEEHALRPDLIGLKIFEEPIFAIGDAKDPLFQGLKDDKVVSKEYITPTEWLSDAKTVISIFFPYTKDVRDGNKKDMSWPSSEWLNANREGIEITKFFINYLCDELKKHGYSSISPCFEENFEILKPNSERGISSNWSERHTAYICGIGTFGMHRGIITKKGSGGWIGSIVTSCDFPVDKRQYEGLYDYCIECGKCAVNCPAKAIDKSKELNYCKDNMTCLKFLSPMMEKGKLGIDIRPKEDIESGYVPKKMRLSYGCGKCQVVVPCEYRIPKKEFR